MPKPDATLTTFFIFVLFCAKTFSIFVRNHDKTFGKFVRRAYSDTIKVKKYEIDFLLILSPLEYHQFAA